VHCPKVNVAAKLSIKLVFLHACLRQLKLLKVMTPTAHSTFQPFSSVIAFSVLVFSMPAKTLHLQFQYLHFQRHILDLCKMCYKQLSSSVDGPRSPPPLPALRRRLVDSAINTTDTLWLALFCNYE
jgi:hypothetical protein